MGERTIHPGQRLLMEDARHTEHLINAGIRYGKTTAGVVWHHDRVKKNKGSKISLIVAPTYRLAKHVCLRAYRTHLLNMGKREGSYFRINKSDLTIYFPRYDHTVLILSGESPESIIGFTSSHAWIDESASCDEEVRTRVLERNSFSCPYQQTLHTTTPIGTENWLYDVFGPHKVPRVEGTPHSISEKESKIVLHGRTHDNPYLSRRYLETLERELSWNDARYRNYVLGEWVSLGTDRFYYEFDESKHTADLPPDSSKRLVYLSFDNNVGRMAWVAGQQLDRVEKGLAIVAANRSDAEDYIVAVQQIVKVFPPAIWKNHHFHIYGDAVLWNRTGAALIPFILIKELLKKYYPNVELRAKRPPNPFITDRSLCTNRFFGENRLVINKSCTAVILSARTCQVDRNGKIKKPKDDKVTHPMEAVDRITMALDPIVSLIRRGGEDD